MFLAIEQPASNALLLSAKRPRPAIASKGRNQESRLASRAVGPSALSPFLSLKRRWFVACLAPELRLVP
jgi:hypothetical protein